MTTEEKAKAYDEALEKAKKYHEEYWQVDAKDITETLFPQLRESEDEKIRKEIIDFLETIPASELKRIPRPISEWFSYLAKQKEQKPAEKQDYSGLNDLERVIHRGFLSAGVENVPVGIIKETAQECLAEMKPAEWSEEDERLLNIIIDILDREEHNGHLMRGDLKACVKLLKSLRSQTKQEWSEEDEAKLRHALFNTYAADTATYLLGKVKSLRPSWKPSEEQMDALKNSAYGVYQNGDGPVLRELYEQLKKLM